jgi:hypothetical protein
MTIDPEKPIGQRKRRHVWLLLIAGALSIAMQCTARVQSRSSGANLQRRDYYLLLFFVGLTLMSVVSGSAIFLFMTRRFPMTPRATFAGVAAALVVAGIVFFCGLYWPWMLGMY